LAVAPTENKLAIDKLLVAEHIAGSRVAVDNNYSWNTYVRSPSIQKILYPFPSYISKN
jgi:hypothetical protein